MLPSGGVATVGPGRAYALPITASKVTPPTVDQKHSVKLLIRNDFVMCSEKDIVAS